MPDRPLKGLLVCLLLFHGHLAADCREQALKPSDVQGTGNRSALTGHLVTVEGVMTLDSRQPGGWRGFYLQSTNDQSDNDPLTSDALFVYTDLSGGEPGSRVRVTGRVKEFHGLTELARVSDLTVCGTAPLPDPIAVELPWSGPAAPEHLENMLVTFEQPLVLIGHYSFARYGELMLADQAQVIPTELMPPGPDAQSMAQQQALSRIHLDDGKSIRNPRPLPWPAALIKEEKPVRAGDRVSDLAGVLDYRFGHWRIQPIRRPQWIGQPVRPDPPARPDAANVRVAMLNLANFFNGEGPGQGFNSSRGARSQKQFMAQKTRLVATLTRLDADVIAAAEMENDHYGPDSAIAELAAALGPEWNYIRTPGATGSDAIRTDLLYRTDRVEAVGQPKRLNYGAFSGRGRPPVAQRFRAVQSSSAASVRIVVPHFKSKACGGANGENRDQQDGQGCYARRRTNEAKALANWLKNLPQPDHLAGTLVIGDLNSYAREWPVELLEESGLTNLVRIRQGCESASCPGTTYRYQGRQGSLDHALASEGLNKRLIGAGVWPINAEEFRALGYQGALQAPLNVPWRSSDHNPLYIDLAL